VCLWRSFRKRSVIVLLELHQPSGKWHRLDGSVQLQTLKIQPACIHTGSSTFSAPLSLCSSWTQQCFSAVDAPPLNNSRLDLRRLVVSLITALFLNSGPHDPPPCMFSMFPSFTTPDSNEWLLIRPLQSFESATVRLRRHDSFSRCAAWRLNSLPSVLRLCALTFPKAVDAQRPTSFRIYWWLSEQPFFYQILTPHQLTCWMCVLFQILFCFSCICCCFSPIFNICVLLFSGQVSH